MSQLRTDLYCRFNLIFKSVLVILLVLILYNDIFVKMYNADLEEYILLCFDEFVIMFY